MQGRISGNILLRRKQYEVSRDNPVGIAANIVAAKINASRKVLLRQLRTEDNATISHDVNVMKSYLDRLKTVDSLETVRGIEGEAAARYFAVFNELILNKDFVFNGRSRRPPLDPVNAMLSFMYAIVGKDISAALEGVGLDPQAGFLHADRPGRDSLAQDLLEEFRAWLVDRLVLTVINRKQVSLSSFSTELSGAVRMSADTRKVLLSEYQARKQESVMHPIIEEETPVGLLPHVQAQLLARHLRGDYAAYPPFVAR
jgi:CRISPR-associated protein Cas1